MRQIDHSSFGISQPPEKDSNSAAFCVAIVAIAFLGSISKIRYVTLDDRWYAAWVWNDSWLRSAFDFAAQQGRLLKPSSFTYYFPYLSDSVFWYSMLRLGPILASSIVAGLLLQQVTRSASATLLFILLFFAFAQNSNEHNLFVAYPFAWEFSWICWMVGLLGLMAAIERESLFFSLAGAIVLLVGLQEGFLPHTIILIVAGLSMSNGKRSWRYLVPYLIGILCWVALWLWWRVSHPSTYGGSTIAFDGSLYEILHTLVNYSVGGMPFATVLYGGSTVSLKDILNLHVLSFIKSLVVFFGVVWLLTSSTPSTVLSRMRPFSILLGSLFVLVLLPNLALALTPKYQEWSRFGVHAYLYSHFSYFAWIGIGVIGVLAAHQRWRYKSLRITFAVLAGLASIVTDASNAVVNNEQEMFGLRWNTMFKVFASEEFKNIPNGSTIFFSDTSLTGTEHGDAEYWNFVISARTKKILRLTSDPAALGKYPSINYYMYLYDEPRSSNRYVLLAPLDAVSGLTGFVSKTFVIFPDTDNERMEVGGTLNCPSPICLASVSAEGHASSELFASVFSISTKPRVDELGIIKSKIETSLSVDVRSVWVDFARNRRAPVAAVRIVAAEGFRGWEYGGGTSFNWSSVESTLELRNSTDKDVQVIVDFWLVGGDSRYVDVLSTDGISLAKVQFDGSNPGHVRIPAIARKGTTSILLKSEQPPLYGDSVNGVAFQLRDLGVSVAVGSELNNEIESNR